MEKKQGFFSALKEEVVRGLSPVRSRSKSPARTGSPMSALLRRKKSSASGSRSNYVPNPEAFIARSGSMRPLGGETLTPLMEGPDPDGGEIGGSKRVGLGQWMKVQLSRAPSITSSAYASNNNQQQCSSNYPHNNNNSNNKRSDLRLLLGVMGAPLAPVHVSTMDPLPHLSIKDTPIVSNYYALSVCVLLLLGMCQWAVLT